jgi:hypothetical protein
MNMRLSLLLAMVVLMTGCMTVRPYDPIEYGLSITVTVNATRAIHQCDDPSQDNEELWVYIQQMNTDSLNLSEFINDKGNSTNLLPLIKQIRDMVNDTLIRGKFSSAYCVHKLSNIQAGSRILARVLGNTDRFDTCEGGIRARYDGFTKSYQNNDINASEYKELVMDIVKLETIDTSGCSQSTRQKIAEDLVFIKENLPAILGL